MRDARHASEYIAACAARSRAVRDMYRVLRMSRVHRCARDARIAKVAIDETRACVARAKKKLTVKRLGFSFRAA
jgi:hypothetical protein